jgi:hypothetical protein
LDDSFADSGFSLFLITSFVLVAISSALVAFLAIEVALGMSLCSKLKILMLSSCAGLILVSFLILQLFLAFFLTSFAISTYLFVRFITHVRSGGRSGVREWATETKEQFFMVKKPSMYDSDSEELIENKGKDREGHEIHSGYEGVKVEG